MSMNHVFRFVAGIVSVACLTTVCVAQPKTVDEIDQRIREQIGKDLLKDVQKAKDAKPGTGSTKPATPPNDKGRRPEAPYGYLVYSLAAKGKTLPKGHAEKSRNVIKLAGGQEIAVEELTTSAGDALRTFHRLNANPDIRVYRKDLAKKEYERHSVLMKAANAPANDPKFPSVAGTVWIDSRLDNWWFDASGKLEIGERRGITSNDRGTWSQKGKEITISTRAIGKQTRILDGNKMTYGLNVLKKSK